MLGDLYTRAASEESNDDPDQQAEFHSEEERCKESNQRGREVFGINFCDMAQFFYIDEFAD